MDTALPQKFPFILDRNLAKADCTEDRICTSCDKIVLFLNFFQPRPLHARGLHSRVGGHETATAAVPVSGGAHQATDGSHRQRTPVHHRQSGELNPLPPNVYICYYIVKILIYKKKA